MKNLICCIWPRFEANGTEIIVKMALKLQSVFHKQNKKIRDLHIAEMGVEPFGEMNFEMPIIKKNNKKY